MAADSLSGLKRTEALSASLGQKGLVRPGFWWDLVACPGQ